MAAHQVTFYVQLAPEWYDGHDGQGRRALYTVRPVRMTATQPRNPVSGAVVVPVSLWVDPALFGPTDAVHAQVVAGPDGAVRLEVTP